MTAIHTLARLVLRFLVVWVVDTFSLIGTALIIPGIMLLPEEGQSTGAIAVAAALMLGIVNLLIRPIVPAQPSVSFLDWTTVDAQEFLSGWKVELRGATGEFRVRLETGGSELFSDGFESGGLGAWGQ